MHINCWLVALQPVALVVVTLVVLQLIALPPTASVAVRSPCVMQGPKLGTDQVTILHLLKVDFRPRCCGAKDATHTATPMSCGHHGMPLFTELQATMQHFWSTWSKNMIVLLKYTQHVLDIDNHCHTLNDAKFASPGKAISAAAFMWLHCHWRASPRLHCMARHFRKKSGYIWVRFRS